MRLTLFMSVLGFLLLVGGVTLIYWKAGLVVAGVGLLLVGLFTEVTDATDRPAPY